MIFDDISNAFRFFFICSCRVSRGPLDILRFRDGGAEDRNGAGQLNALFRFMLAVRPLYIIQLFHQHTHTHPAVFRPVVTALTRLSCILDELMLHTRYRCSVL